MSNNDYMCPKCKRIAEKFPQKFHTFNMSCPDCAELFTKFYHLGVGLQYSQSGTYKTYYKGN